MKIKEIKLNDFKNHPIFKGNKRLSLVGFDHENDTILQYYKNLPTVSLDMVAGYVEFDNKTYFGFKRRKKEFITILKVNEYYTLDKNIVIFKMCNSKIIK